MNTTLSCLNDRLMRLNNSIVILGKLPCPVDFLVILERDGYNHCRPLCWGAILFIPIHFFIEQPGWGCRGCAEGFRLVDTEEKGSFKEVTDEARGDWPEEVCSMLVPCCRPNFSSSGTVDQDKRIHRRRELLFPLQTSGNSEK